MPVGVFSGRSTRVVFNDYPPSVVQAWIASQRDGSEMCKSASSFAENCSYRPNIGWMLDAYHLQAGSSAWLTAAQAGNITPSAGNATAAPNFVEQNKFAKVSVTGVTYDASVQSSGTPFLVHAPPAGTDWSGDVLTADQTAFPSPDTASDYTPQDRVFVSTPGEVEPWDAIEFCVIIPAAITQPRGTIATFYFNGPASYDGSGLAGLGQYSLKLRGDGRAYLFERMSDYSWKPRFSFKWNVTNTPVPNSLVVITITNDVFLDASGAFQGSKMTFWQGNIHFYGGFSVVRELAQVAEQAIRFEHGMVPTFTVPRIQPAPTWVEPVRIDVARDCKAAFRMSKHVYFDSGYFIDDFIPFNQPVTADEPILILWSGTLPTGTGWSVEAYDQNGAALVPLTPVATFDSPGGQVAYRYFTPTDKQTYIQARFDLASDSSHFRSPRIGTYTVFRNAVASSLNPVSTYTVPKREAALPALWEQTVAAVDITPQETDPGAENAHVQIWDMTGDLAFLEDRNMNPMRVEVYNGAEWCPIFSGYAMEPHGTRMRNRAGRGYPNIKWTKWDVGAVGEWARFSQSTMPARQVWAYGDAGGVYKVTDALRLAAQGVYSPDMVDVFDSPIQMFGFDGSTYVSEPGTRYSEFCSEVASDFLGAYWVFDEAAGDRGMLRLLPQKTAPYNNLAAFEIEHATILAGDSLPRIPQWSQAYGTTFDGLQEIQHTFIQAGTYNFKREAAEGNCVIVTGAASSLDAGKAGASQAAQLVQVAINVGSYNFLNLAPGDPGYPDGSSPEYFNRIVPIRVFDYKLPDQNAVDWKCRRVYEKSCFSRYYLSFTAPMLLVTDTTDPLQRTPRRLRFYDAVLVRGYDGALYQFLVMSCAPSYVKDNIQMATYSLVTQSNINTIGVMPHNMGEFLTAVMAAMAKRDGTGHSKTKRNFSDQAQGLGVNNPMMGLPTPPSYTIQDLDNTSPTFGEFWFLPGYSTLGGPDVMRP